MRYTLGCVISRKGIRVESKAILIVDDEIDILIMFREIFGERGWKVFTAPTAAAAMAILEKNPIALVLLDLKMPGVLGLDTLKEIRKKYPHIPVIMVTAAGYDNEFAGQAIRLGAAGYISKAMPIIDLLRMVNGILPK